MKQIVLIDRKGREAFRLPIPEVVPVFLYHAGKQWGFGVAKLNGEQHFYQTTPETPPMGPLADGRKEHHAMKNNNCDNDKCRSATGEVRVLPTGGDSNAILCRACFAHEMQFRRERNLELSKDCQFKLPAWESLKVYAPYTPYQPKTGQTCHCKPGVQRDNCPDCEGTGQRINFVAIRARLREVAL